MNNSQLYLGIKEIFLFSPKNSKEISETFVFEPDNPEEDNLGRLMMMGSLNEDGNISSLINLLASVIKREYYADVGRNSATALEASLKKANSTLAEFVLAKKVTWPLNFNFVCASLKDETLFFSRAGDATLLLCREGKIHDIGKQLNNDVLDANPYKTFQNTASGELKKGDRLILTPINIRKIATKEKIKQIVSLENNLEKINDELQKIWEKENKNKLMLNLALIILSLEEPKNELLELGFNLNTYRESNLHSNEKELTLEEIIKEAQQKSPLE